MATSDIDLWPPLVTPAAADLIAVYTDTKDHGTVSMDAVTTYVSRNAKFYGLDAQGTPATPATIPGNGLSVPIIYQGDIVDTTGGYNSETGDWICAKSGYWLIHAKFNIFNMEMTGGNTSFHLYFELRANGATVDVTTGTFSSFDLDLPTTAATAEISIQGPLQEGYAISTALSQDSGRDLLLSSDWQYMRIAYLGEA